MGYVLTEIVPWILTALIAGLFLGLVFWWCRWWLTRSREEELVETRSLLDARRDEVDSLESRLTESQGEVSSLRRLMAAANAEVGRLQARVRELEDARTDLETLEARMAELMRENAELAVLRQQLIQLEGVDAERSAVLARLADLEGVDVEAAELRRQVQRMESERSVFMGRVGDLERQIAVLEREDRPPFASPPDELESVPRTSLGEVRASASEPREMGFVDLRTEIDERGRMSSDEPAAGQSAPAEVELDLTGGRSVLGFNIRLDDLKVVEGIGPKIEELLQSEGIDTWQKLGTIDPAQLTGILREAGSRFQMHDPGTWPQQAALLATGRWEEFRELTDELVGGRR